MPRMKYEVFEVSFDAAGAEIMNDLGKHDQYNEAFNTLACRTAHHLTEIRTGKQSYMPFIEIELVEQDEVIRITPK